MIVVGLDPGFRALGFAVLEIGASSERVLGAGVIRTKPTKKKKSLFASTDNVLRMRRIRDELVPIFWHGERPSVVCTEAQSWGFPNAKTHGQMGMAWGVVICVTTGLPLLEVPTDDLKEAVTGDANANKPAVIAAVGRRYPEAVAMIERVNKGNREHAADAIGSVVASLNHDLIVGLRSAQR